MYSEWPEIYNVHPTVGGQLLSSTTTMQKKAHFLKLEITVLIYSLGNGDSHLSVLFDAVRSISGGPPR